jgi:hypothetical protein
VLALINHAHTPSPATKSRNRFFARLWRNPTARKRFTSSRPLARLPRGFPGV